VGAIIVRDGEVVGRGHRDVVPIREVPPLYRVVHAEAAALAEVGVKASGATLYVTLEPCASRGSGRHIQPGEVCSSLIPRHGVSTVVVGLTGRPFL
jgi:diaminohydroxyphosphoribosylaminopyrimidine deaminase/5-amino-6-(5-phosphoribosylamino)uracil reductase